MRDREEWFKECNAELRWKLGEEEKQDDGNGMLEEIIMN